MEFYQRREADSSLPHLTSFWHKLALSTLSCLQQKLAIYKKNHGVWASAVASHNQAAVSANVPNDSRHISTTSEFDLNTNLNYASQNSTPYTAQSVALGVPGSIPGKGRWFFSSQKCPDQLLDLPSLLFNLYGGVLSPGLSGWGVKLTIRLYLVPRLGMHWAVPLVQPYAFMTCTWIIYFFII